jgi:von Willebrand factor type A domain
MPDARSAPSMRRRAPRWLRINAPSWLVSLVVHMALVLMLLWTVEKRPHGLESAVYKTGMVALTSEPADVDTDYFNDEEPSGSATIVAAEDSSPGAVGAILEDKPPVDTAAALPRDNDALGMTSGEPGRATGAGGFTRGSAGSNAPKGGGARTRVFGIEAEGQKFVYVFDRSGSMGGSGRNSPLNAAKAELLASLESLGDTQQFQIIFYNERPTIFALAGQPGKLVFGNEQNKISAQKFVRGIIADGGTRHLEALELALKLHPDVIFFLTDADQPELSPAQLAKINRTNGGSCSINAIEFGLGPEIGADNFLVRLARENGGRHTYVDVSRPAAMR